jgi:hypothetical protein
MRNRVIASLITILIGAALVPDAAFARGGSGGAMGGRGGFAAHGTFHAFHGAGVINPGVMRASPMHVSPMHVSPVNVSPVAGSFVRFHNPAIAPNRRFVRFFGRGFPANGIGVWYGGFGDYYGNDDVTGALGPQPIYVPVPAEADTPVPPPAVRTTRDRGNCGTQTQTVRSESGGERQITIVRC